MAIGKRNTWARSCSTFWARIGMTLKASATPAASTQRCQTSLAWPVVSALGTSNTVTSICRWGPHGAVGWPTRRRLRTLMAAVVTTTCGAQSWIREPTSFSTSTSEVAASAASGRLAFECSSSASAKVVRAAAEVRRPAHGVWEVPQSHFSRKARRRRTRKIAWRASSARHVQRRRSSSAKTSKHAATSAAMPCWIRCAS
mmetsp:Transcript_66015/g.183880  ORF Transcript_66015/g.183880 Transcript_66015/m.183880 type:complete len:200 (+) Transcript_66015:838-1437(+)